MQILTDLVREHSDSVALILAPANAAQEPRSLTQKELFNLVRTLAASLPHQSRSVALSMKNSIEFVVSFLGVAGRAGVVSPLNPQTTEKEAIEIFTDAAVDCVLVDDDKAGAVAAAAKLKIAVFLIEVGGSLRPLNDVAKASKPQGAKVPFPSAKPSDVALYLFTSGTTSKPKLVPLTHTNMLVSILNIRNHYELGPSDRSYCVMPLFHIHGLQSALFGTLAGAGTVILPDEGKFSASVFWRDVIKFNATWYTAVPTIHQILLARADLDGTLIKQNKLRFIRSCSSSLAPAVLEKLEAVTGRPVLEAYAMTEAAHQMTSNPLPKHGPHKPGSVGRATNVQLKIDGSNDKARAVGEVCIRGDNVMLGYMNRPEANAEAFDKDGWFRTGDLGYLDDYGYLFLVGRIKEIVNRGGEKISPPEIDAALLTAPGVGEAVSFGMPSTKYGEELYAAVVKSGLHKGELKEADLLAYLSSKLSKVKVPTKIFIVDIIPKNATGKVQRKNLAVHFAKIMDSQQGSKL